MDLEILEALALSDDRIGALAQLLPGSEDHDYFRGLAALHAGALDDAEIILNAWPDRHGTTERYTRLRTRAMFDRLARGGAADQTRDWMGVSHWHEAEVPAIDPTRPTRLPDNTFVGANLLRDAVNYDSNLQHVHEEGCYELLDAELDASRRRVLLNRLSHIPGDRIVELIAIDLADRNVQFGSLLAHNALTLAQLHALLALRLELASSQAWVGAVVRRMQPPASVDLELDLPARLAHLEQLWAFLDKLPPANNSLKVHVLWHLLDTTRRLGQPADRARFASYLQLPREASYRPRDYLRAIAKQDLAQPGADFRAITGLPPAGDDETLVRALLHELIADAERFAAQFDRAWLDVEIATARLLQGAPDAERSTLALGPVRAAALRDRIEIAWAPHVPTRFAELAEVALDVDVKHVAELVVKVFRVDPLAYFQHHKREVSTDLDLDGLAASHEEVLRFVEPPVRRVRRTIALPSCARPGTYIVDLIGNGQSSRAVIYKGRLRHVVRIGAAGHVVTIVDEAGAFVPSARAWIGDREYTPDAKSGAFVVPFSTAPARTPMLLVAGEIATVAHLDLVRESYALAMDLVVEREALTSGRTAKAIARIALACAGRPASLGLLERATWDVTLTDRAGVPTTKSQPLVLSDDRAAVLEWPMGEDIARVSVAIRGSVKVISEQREQHLTDAASAEVATINGTFATEALYLANTAAGWVVYALGKTGEPRAQRPVTVSMLHRFANMQTNTELATDAHGRVELGALPGVTRIMVTLGGASQTWYVDAAALDTPIHAIAGTDVVVPIAMTRDATETILRSSLVELRGDVPHSHPHVALEPLAGAIAIRGLAPGHYELRAAGCRARIVVAEPGPIVGTSAIAPGGVVELSAPRAVIAELDARDGLRVVVRGATRSTRVHVIASRFTSSLVEPLDLANREAVARRTDRTVGALYISGRELGDEYRYILDRRTATRFPGLLVERPGLLLNPWARRTTTTDVAVAKAGGDFARASAPRGAAYGMAPQAQAQAAGSAEAYVTHDFLPEAPVVLANLPPGTDGEITLSRAQLGRATSLTVIVDGPGGANARRVALVETAVDPRDLRLLLALDPARHVTQRRQIAPLRTGETLVIDDLATAKLHLIDSLERAHAYLLALRDDATLREFAFVARWHALDDLERREHYTKYACHELHVFLYFKDRAFFDALVRPHLAHKRTKTFIDHFLLEADLTPYLEPVRLAQLNAVELALLATRLAATDTLARVLGDRVAIQPPDPARDTRLIDALLGASALDGDERIAEASNAAYQSAKAEITSENMPAMLGAASFGPPPSPAMMMAPAPAARPSPKRELAKKAKGRAPAAHDDESEMSSDDGYGGDSIALDRLAREESAPMFRAADKTQEYAEHNWWHLTPAQSDASLIAASKLWKELAAARGTPILSPSLGLAITNFAEAMCALAVIELPFIAPTHAITPEGPRLTIVATGNALAGTSQLVDGELVSVGPPLVVGQNYVRTDDRYDYATGEQVDKYVTGPLAVGVVYTCQIVLANPSSSRQRIAALVQIPRGSLPIGGGKPTATIDVVLAPYGTHGHEYAFYFPVAGRYTHFPIHVTRDQQIVAAAPPRTLEVVAGNAAPDPGSWAHISQHGSIDQVVAYLGTANLAITELARCAWRARDRSAYQAIVTALEARRTYDATLWGYALLHGDAPRIRAFVRASGRLGAAGPVVASFDHDAEDVGAFEHLEYAPLINARAHRLGPKLRILNDGFASQYARFLDHVAHRSRPSARDLVAATAYYLVQDRYAEAIATLARVDRAGLAEQMQYDYLAAYLACLTGDLGRAHTLAAAWTDPPDHWRRRFAALLAMLDGGAPVVIDPKSRDQQQSDLAAKQPTFELAVDRDGVVIRSQHVAALELRYFEMDVELLFSRQPFVASDVSRFSFIEPGHRDRLADLAGEHRVPWSAALRGKNVVVEAVGAGTRRAKVHYANDLATTLANQYGQIRVQRASDQAAMPATYVKVYARKRGGAVAFYKDGYTDLRGWFDYASVSTTDLDDVERFAILVCSDAAGAAILEANPPAR